MRPNRAPRATDGAAHWAPNHATTQPASDITSQRAVAEAAGSDVPPREAAERLTFGTYAVVTQAWADSPCRSSAMTRITSDVVKATAEQQAFWEAALARGGAMLWADLTGRDEEATVSARPG